VPRWLVAAAAVLSLASLAACGSAAARATSAPIRIGAIYPVSGPQGSGGLSEERGVELAALWVNQHGGIRGRPISLDEQDVPTAESVPSAMAQLQRQHIRLVVGTHGSTMSAVAAEVAQQQHMLIWETGAVGDLDMDDGAVDAGGAGSSSYGSSGSGSGAGGDWSPAAVTGPSPVTGMGTSFFRMAPQGASLGRAGIDFVLRQLSPRLPGHPALRVAVAYVDDAYGLAVAQGVIEQVRADRVELAGVYPYPEYGADFTALASAIKRSGANVLYASSYLADGEALRRATIAQHVALAASVGTSSSYCLQAFGDQLQAAAVGLFASDKAAAYSINPDGLLPEGRLTLRWAEAQWQRRYGGQMDAYATSGFANAYALFAHVLQASASLTPDSVAAAARTVRLPMGTLADGSGLDFPARGPEVGENQAAASVIWEWVAPGKEVVVWPRAFATHPVTVLTLES
jgi:branched-chain amino acid transport system substrate-binding protein